MELALEAEPPEERAACTLASSAPERFAAFVAHELRTPLAIQRARLELALADPDADLAAWRTTGKEVLRACERQERLIAAGLTLARSRSGLPQREPVNVAAATADALRAHDVGKLECIVALEQAWTTGSPDLIERLIANLVSNAIRHNVAGGRIDVATRAEPGCAVVSIANSGVRIPPGELKRLFQPFQRLDASPRTFGDGLGLGLTIVRAIADAHKALVSARTRTGGGLAIDVTFPAPD